MTLYFKFRPIDKFALDVVINNRLYLADWTELNDAHEAQMLVYPHEGVPFCYHANPRRLIELSNGALGVEDADARVCSLSKSWGSNLLWSHYCDGHRGVAVGFEIEILPEGIEIIEVQYDDLVPTFTAPLSTDAVRTALAHKSREWAYEGEVRLLSFKPGLHYVGNLKIRDLTFGLRAAWEDIKLFSEITKDRDIDFYKVSIKPGKYAVAKSEINYELGRK